MARAVTLLAGAFNALAGAALVFMLLNVAGTIVARLIHALSGGALNMIWRGSYELAVLALTVVVFASLHRAFVVGAIRIELFTDFMPQSVKRVIDGVFGLVYGVFAAAMTWRFTHAVAVTYERGDATQDLLLPLYWIYLFLATASGALTVVAIGWSLAAIAGKTGDRARAASEPST
ncbi:MAG: TRAP transporter small permease [Burkholderiaceae bacterium]|nr:TRAP transporter small permease [Burkholderiaceae bacterium]